LRAFDINSEFGKQDYDMNPFMKLEKVSLSNSNSGPLLEESCHRFFRSSKHCLRGGGGEGFTEKSQKSVYSELSDKLNRYKEKVLNDLALEKELSLYIEARAKSNNGAAATDHHDDNKDKESFELALDIRKNFLNNHDPASKVLILTGDAGIGKSFFCKNFQREILFGWEDSQNQGHDERNWLPLYIDLSSLKKTKSEAISEILIRELSLTEEEILIIQTSEPSNLLLPRLLLIFDGYDDIIQDIHDPREREKDYISNNFCKLSNLGI